MSNVESENTGLTSEHDYAVTDFAERNGKRMLLVKNPWSQSGGWISGIATDGAGDATCDEDQGTLQRTEAQRDAEVGEHCTEPGNFWMDINDVFQYFESLYLNWNPGLFAHREDVHFLWDLSNSNGPWGSFSNNPQFKIQSRAGGVAWLVLSRHFQSEVQAAKSVAKGLSTGHTDDIGFISLYLFDGRGDRIYLADGCPIRAPYVDSPNLLLKVDLLKGIPYTLVVSEQDLPRSNHSFTLCAYSVQPMNLSRVQDRYRSHVVQNGAWTPTSAGGNASSPAYSRNPQFSLTLSHSSDMSLLLELRSGDFPVHVRLLRAEGRHLRRVPIREIVGDSGEYRKGHALAEMSDVPKGQYVVVCSTFEQGQVGEFTLCIGTIADCVVERISITPAGRFVHRLGMAFFEPGIDRLWASLKCTRITRLSVVAQAQRAAGMQENGQPSSDVPLRLSLVHGQGSMRQILASSGTDEFSNAHYGTHVNDVDIQPFMCAQRGVWIVLERGGPLDAHDPKGIDVEVHSDTGIETGTWHEIS
ncbi:MAG: hypothetical protein LQ352_000446 [Teloschistes flavicans]|nr:MAG: hypothetical protein LQ352_000446 [Teloschistes flavicans]